MISADSLSALLTDILEKSSSKVATGTQLAHLVKIAEPTLNFAEFGCINLRDFVRKYAKRITEIGRAGQDIQYGLSQGQQLSKDIQAADLRPLTTPPFGTTRRLDPRVWKTFSNPNSAFRVFGNKTTGDICVLSRFAAETGDPWVAIPSVSADFHKETASQFLTTVSSEAQKRSLAETLTLPRWWEHFYSLTKSLGISREWTSLRSRRILQKFEEALSAAGVPAYRQPSSPTLEARTSPAQPPSSEPSPPLNDTSVLRQLAINAIQRMSLTELRALNIPLGYIADGLATK